MSTLGMAKQVEEQKGARSRNKGKLTCLLSFLLPDIVCWNLLRWRVRTAGGQKMRSCLLPGEEMVVLSPALVSELSCFLLSLSVQDWLAHCNNTRR